MKPICIIPARSGSKGLKDKNVLFFDGKPILLHTVDAAIDSGVFTRDAIYVSTDSTAYADLAKSRGIRIHERPIHLAQDDTPTFAVNEAFLQDFSEAQPFVLLQPTSPLRTAQQIKEAVDLFQRSGANHLVSYTKADKSPSLFTQISSDGMITNAFGSDRNYRRQEQGDYYYPNGAIFISTKKQYLNDRTYFTDKTVAYLMDKETSLDIDDEIDFKRVIASRYFDYQLREQGLKETFREQYASLADKQLLDKLIVGDSRLVGFQAKGYTNISLPGVTLHTFMENKALFFNQSIRHLIIVLGVNDIVTGYGIDSLKEQYTNLIAICNERQIQLSLGSIALTLYRLIDNTELQLFNAWLEKLAKCHNLLFIDVNEGLIEEGQLAYDMTSDGLHFSEEGQIRYFKNIENLTDNEE